MEHWIQAEGRFCGQGYGGNVSKTGKTVIRPKLRMSAWRGFAIVSRVNLNEFHVSPKGWERPIQIMDYKATEISI